MSKIDVAKLRTAPARIVGIGSSRGIIQATLDFDYLAGKTAPSVTAVVATGRKVERYFFGAKEVVVPVYGSIDALPRRVREEANYLLVLTSGRRVKAAVMEALEKMPKLTGGSVFAEGVPEQHALAVAEAAGRKGVWMLGAASVGMVVPGVVKLGAIGGVQARQLGQARLFEPGGVAVISSSGGMVNEIIRAVVGVGQRLSFAAAVGGERFPITTPRELFLAAQADSETRAIAYFGELGGTDEYELADLIEGGKVTKPVIAYIAGTVAELFETPPQFGHAKAMAASGQETARAKRDRLKQAGAMVAETFGEFVQAIAGLPGAVTTADKAAGSVEELEGRRPALLVSSVSGDVGSSVKILDENLLELAENNSFARIVVSLFLGHKIKSKQLEVFVDFTLRLLVDHGPYVSGAVNTMVAARAGRDLVSSLASGLLTIGPRFGGAINQAALTWLTGARQGKAPAELVEELAGQGEYIAGIGHRKYRADKPDARVTRLMEFREGLSERRFTNYALAVQAVTLQKRSNLILNVDGAIAAVMLDLLAEEEGYNDDQLQALVATEFFNGLFVLSRSVGFMAHYFDQLRLDEGIFRLTPQHVARVEPPERSL